MQGNAELTVGCSALATFGYGWINIFPYSHSPKKVPWTSEKSNQYCINQHNYDSTPQLKGK